MRAVSVTIDLTDTTVLVTGAGGGIGRAVVRRFLAARATVVAQVRSTGELPGSCRLHVVRGDLSDTGFLADFLAAHPVDVLVNNAGAYPSGALLDTSRDSYDAVMDANAGITFAALREAARAMAARSGGAIVNIGSLSASRPGRGTTAYDSAKAAVVALTRSAAAELAPYGIRVNAVSPGLVDRPGLDRAWPDGVAAWQQRVPLGRLGQATDVADAVLFLASPMASWITGQELLVDGGMSAAPAY